MKRNISMNLLFAFLLLTACSGQEKGVLTRLDVQKADQDGNYDEVVMITDHQTLELVKKTFEGIKWFPNTKVNMAREADVKAVLFFEFDENMPERLVEYKIWFNENAGTSEIVSNNEKEGYGELEKDHTTNLREILLK